MKGRLFAVLSYGQRATLLYAQASSNMCASFESNRNAKCNFEVDGWEKTRTIDE